MIDIFLESSHWEFSENFPITLAWERVSIRFKNYNNTRKLNIETFQSLKSATDRVGFQKKILPKIYIWFLKLLKFFRKGLVYRYEISSCLLKHCRATAYRLHPNSESFDNEYDSMTSHISLNSSCRGFFWITFFSQEPVTFVHHTQ